MKKKHTIETLGLSALLLLSGCATHKVDTKNTTAAPTTTVSSTLEATTEATTESSDSIKDTAETEDPDNMILPTYYNIPLRIADKDGNKISEVSFFGNYNLTDHGVLYTKLPKKDDNSVIEYRLFDLDTKEDKKLGEMSGLSYQTAYSYIEMNGKLYTLAMTGNLLDEIPDPLLLLEIDLEKGGINQYVISENGYPYVALCQAGQKVLAFTHDQQDDGLLIDRVMEFDPETQALREVMIFKFSEHHAGDTVRALYSDGKSIYLLRVHVENDVSSLILDTYDMSYAKTGEQDITQIFLNSIPTSELIGVEAVTESNPKEADMYYQVSRFFITPEGDLFYCNFSDEIFLVNLKTAKAHELDPLFRASFGSGNPFFGLICQNIDPNEPGSNLIFHLKDDGTLESQAINLFGDQYSIDTMLTTPGGKEAIFMSINDPGHLNTDYPCILYICK